MSDALGSLISEISQSTELGTVLYLGVSGTTAAVLLSVSARHIAVAAPSQLIPTSLAQQAAVTPRLSLHPVLVSDTTGQAQLTIFNFPALSSTRVPSTTLRNLFPNLTDTRQIDIETVTLNDLATKIPLGDDLPNLLVIDTPGNENAVIAALHSSECTARFAHIILHAGSDAMYEGALSFGQLSDQLFDAGYRPERRKAEDPDFPCVHFRLEPLFLQLKELIPRLKLVSEDNKVNQGRIEALVIQTDELKAELEKSQAALTEKSEALRQKAEKLTALEATHAQGQEARQKAEKQSSELKAELEKSQAALTEKSEALRQKAEKLTALEATHAQGQEARQKAEKQSSELKAELEKAQKQLQSLATLRQQLREQDAALHEERTSSRELKDELLRLEAQMELLREFMTLGALQQKIPPLRRHPTKSSKT